MHLKGARGVPPVQGDVSFCPNQCHLQQPTNRFRNRQILSTPPQVPIQPAVTALATPLQPSASFSTWATKLFLTLFLVTVPHWGLS